MQNNLNLKIQLLKRMKKKLPRFRVRAIIMGRELELIVGINNELGMRYFYTELPKTIYDIALYLDTHEEEIVQLIKDFCEED